eukprot:gene1596-1936_t
MSGSMMTGPGFDISVDPEILSDVATTTDFDRWLAKEFGVIDDPGINSLMNFPALATPIAGPARQQIVPPVDQQSPYCHSQHAYPQLQLQMDMWQGTGSSSSFPTPSAAIQQQDREHGWELLATERQRETITRLEAELIEKLARLSALSEENEVLKLRSAVLEAAVKGREYHFKVIKEHGPPVFDATEQQQQRYCDLKLVGSCSLDEADLARPEGMPKRSSCSITFDCTDGASSSHNGVAVSLIHTTEPGHQSSHPADAADAVSPHGSHMEPEAFQGNSAAEGAARAGRTMCPDDYLNTAAAARGEAANPGGGYGTHDEFCADPAGAGVGASTEQRAAHSSVNSQLGGCGPEEAEAASSGTTDGAHHRQVH